jgi:His/Glu/Gln/Arg/opine family amino acid ABC transporter permease subunit
MATAPVQAETVPADVPPDIRGATAPLPVAIFGLGIAALSAALAGTAIVQILYALAGGPLTPECIAEGLTHYDPKSGNGIKGAEGVCHIVMGLQSTGETILLGFGLLAGLAAAVAGFAIYRRQDTVRKREQCVAGAVLGVQAIAVSVFLLWFRSTDTVFIFVRNFLNFTVLRPYLGGFVTGARNTLMLALGGEIGGIVIGLTLALFILSSRRVVRAPARVYINFFRGTPLIWQLSFFYFLFLLGFGIHMGVNQSFYTAFIVFSLNTGAYASEVFRAGIQSIERGQMEAARGLGFSYLQAMRFAIVPQAIRRVIPPLLNEFVILIKDTALIVVLGLIVWQYDLYTQAQNGYSETFSATFFVGAAIGYLVITLPAIWVVNLAERHLRSGLVGVNVGQAG